MACSEWGLGRGKGSEWQIQDLGAELASSISNAQQGTGQKTPWQPLQGDIMFYGVTGPLSAWVKAELNSFLSTTPFPLLLHQFAWILLVVKQHRKPWSYTGDIRHCHYSSSSGTAPGKHEVSSHPGQGAAEPRIRVFKPVGVCGKAQMKHLCSLLAVVGSAFSSANSWCLLNHCCCCWQVK